MGLLDAMGNIFRTRNRTKAVPTLAQIDPAATVKSDSFTETAMHWPPNGKFLVDVVGESFYRDAIRKMAQNHSGAKALVYCTATIYPDDANEHDSQAVAIFIGKVKVGHLSRNAGPLLRQALVRSRICNSSTTCDAVIHGGGTFDDREFDYCVELDLNLDAELSECPSIKPTYPVPVCVSYSPMLLRQTETEFFINVPFLEKAVVESCSVGCPVKSWEKPDGNAIYLFAPGSVGGSGRIAAIAKSDFPDLMRHWNDFPYLTVYQISGRSLVLRFGKECDSRYIFRERGKASVLLLNVDQNESTENCIPSKMAVMSVLVDLPSGKQTKDSEPYRSVINLDNSNGREELKRLVASVDVLITYDADFHKQLLSSIVGESVKNKPWGCLRSMWETRSSPYTAADEAPAPGPVITLDAVCESVEVVRSKPPDSMSDCKALADVLFSNAGKTKRSRTYMGIILLNRV